MRILSHFPILILVSICSVFFSQPQLRAASTPTSEVIYQYPFVCDTLARGLRFLKTEKEAGHPLGGGIDQVRVNIETTRRAFFCLEYFNRTMSPAELNGHYGEMPPGWVNAKSVAALLKEARSLFQQLKIPLPENKEFSTPDFPRELREKEVKAK